MATPPSSSTPVSPMPTSPSSSTLVPIKENTADLRTRRRRRQQRRSNDAVLTPTADSLSEIIPTALNLSERLLPIPPPPPPVSLGSVEGRQQPKERRTGHLAPPTPVKIRSVKRKERRPPCPVRDLPGEEKPSSNLAEASFGPSQHKEDLLGEEKPSSDLTDASHGLSQPEEVVEPSWDTNNVVAWRDVDLRTPVYVRMDRLKSFHTHPDLGGPFRNLDEIQSAVETHARGNNIRTSPGLSYKERLIHESLFWPDGTPKISSNFQIAERELENVERLVKALLDKRNDDEGCANELKDIVHWQSICEGADEWYYHLNITVKTKGAGDYVGSANLFFAEVTRDQNETPAYYLSCFSELNDDDKVVCQGCMINGSTDMKHPLHCKYNGGHKAVGFPIGFGPCNDKQWRDPRNAEDDKELIQEQEDRIRASFDYLDDEAFLEKLLKKRRANRSYDINIQVDEEMACED